MSSSEASADARRNREFWNRHADEYQGEHGAFIGRAEPRWGLWQLPERELRILGDVVGKDVLELGCGAAQWSILLAEAGARVVGLDFSDRQLEHARRAMGAAGVDFPLVQASAESVPLPDASFDVVFADHGANRFCDPYLFVPEAARLLRPGGLFAFSGSTPFELLCYSEEEDRLTTCLQRDLFGLHRVELPDSPVEYELPYGEWIRLFRRNGFLVEELREIRPPDGATSTYRSAEETEWARSWPMEQIWIVRKDAGASLRGGEPVPSPLPPRERESLTQHAERNRAVWTGSAPEYAEWAPRAWAQEEPSWGVWGVAEAEVGILPDVRGRDVVELGCGTAYWSAWLARRGARVVGVDVTPAQLETARRMQAELGLEFPLLEASAEAVPLPDASFDLALSEYGASIWADPYLWIPEAARLLRPGGELVFLVNGTLAMLCAPDEEVPPGTELLRPYFGMHRFEWPDDHSVEFHLGYGEWIRLLGEHGLEVVDLVEVQAPPEGPEHRYPGLPTREWARRWPSEEIWKARKRG